MSDAVARVVPHERLRWISFGHFEADECGAMNQWLEAAPEAELAHTMLGVLVSVGDLARRPPRGLADGEVLDLGGTRVRHLATPHVPRGGPAFAGAGAAMLGTLADAYETRLHERG